MTPHYSVCVGFQFSSNVHFQKISIPTPRRVIGITRGRESQKPKFIKESMKQNWNFQGGAELKQKTPLWEGYGCFWNNTIMIFI